MITVSKSLISTAAVTQSSHVSGSPRAISKEGIEGKQPQNVLC